MIGAVLQVMALSLWRDRGALAMVFALPPLMFVVFATIMDGSNGSNLQLKIAVADLTEAPTSARFVAALERDDAFRVERSDLSEIDAVRELVARDVVDAGVVIQSALDGPGAPILLVLDPAKANTGTVLSGQVRRVLGEAMPDVAVARNLMALSEVVGGFSPGQRAMARAATDALAQQVSGDGASGDGDALDGAPEGESVEGQASETNGASGEEAVALGEESGATDAGADRVELLETLSIEEDAPGAVVYYAGAIAIMFLLFTSANAALALIDEREAGVIERLAVYPGAMDALVIGKFLFLTGLGVVQATVIFLVAALLYGVDMLANPVAWVMTTVLAAGFAAAFGLLVAAACGSKQQAGSISNFSILVFSAVGGSMVPRYFMEPWLQDLGWITPNAWVIEAYRSAVGRGAALEGFWLTWALLIAATLVVLTAAVLCARRFVAVRAV